MLRVSHNSAIHKARRFMPVIIIFFAVPETVSELITYLILSIEPSNTIHVK